MVDPVDCWAHPLLFVFLVNQQFPCPVHRKLMIRRPLGGQLFFDQRLVLQ